MRGGRVLSRAAIAAATLAGATVGLTTVAAADAELAATIDLAIDAVGDLRIEGHEAALNVGSNASIEADAEWSLSVTDASAARLGLGSPVDSMVTQWRLPDPTSDSLVVVPLPAPVWTGLGGLAMVSLLGWRQRAAGSNARS